MGETVQRSAPAPVGPEASDKYKTIIEKWCLKFDRANDYI
jgi:hypothetical protein